MPVERAERIFAWTETARPPVLDRVRAGTLPNLDLLRAIAILAVVFSHLAPLTWAGAPYIVFETSVGQLGVLLFFVHTALVLMLSMERMAHAPGWVRRFYLQRVFRLYPLSVLCVVTTLVFRIPPVLNAAFSAPSVLDVFANLALVQNIHSFSISGPMWSLPFEIQMYILLPGVFWLIRKERTFGAAVILTAVATMVTIMEKVLFPRDPWLGEFFPCFFGGIIAYATLRRRPFLPAVAWVPAVAALGIAFCWWCTIRSLIPPWFEWFACVSLGAAIPLFRQIRTGWLSRAASAIARYSYSIYLSHEPLRWLCFERLTLVTWLRWGLFLVLASVVPVVLYHALEAPMIRLGKRLANGLTMAPRSHSLLAHASGKLQ